MFKALTASFLLIVLVCSIFFLNREGKAGRRFGEVRRMSQHPPVYLARTTGQVFDYWREHGFHSRIVVHLGEHLHFVEVDENQGYRAPRQTPLAVQSMLPEYRARLSYLNFLWAAVQYDIAREVYNVLPPGAFRQKVAELTGEGGAWYRAGNRYVSQYYGSLRILSQQLPREREPVLLNIDASYLEGEDVGAVARRLKDSGLSVDAVTLCLSEDSPDVTPNERERLAQLAGILQQ